MSLDWHDRFLRQALWTKPIRDYILKDINLRYDSRVLEVGSGTGVVLNEISNHSEGIYAGIDVDFERTKIAMRNYPEFYMCNADAALLPFPSNCFDLIFCQYFILWLKEPLIVLAEIMRTLKPRGIFAVFAEPDYCSRIDLPLSLEVIGSYQTESLRNQGANPCIGRELLDLLTAVDFKVLKCGVIGYEQPQPGLPEWWRSEWLVITEDLKGLLSYQELKRYQELDRLSWLAGNRVLWVPTYYAVCEKP